MSRRPGSLQGIPEGASPDGLFGRSPANDPQPGSRGLTMEGLGQAGDAAVEGGIDLVWVTLGPTLARSDDRMSSGLGGAVAPAPLVDVQVFCDRFEVGGRLDIGQFDRLSDWINMQSGFIAVQDEARADDDRGAQDGSDGLGVHWVRLSAIILVAQQERRSDDQGWRPAPVIQKEQVRVTMVTPGYRLDGDLHVHAEGSLAEYLALVEPRFLPVTDVCIRSRSDPTQIARYGFALVNREHLVVVGEGR